MRTTAILTLLIIPAALVAAAVFSSAIDGVEHLSVAVAANFQPVAGSEDLTFFARGCMQPPQPDILGGVALCLLAGCVALFCLDRQIECRLEMHALGNLRRNGFEVLDAEQAAAKHAHLTTEEEIAVNTLIACLKSFAGSLNVNLPEDLDRANLTRRLLVNDLAERFRRKRNVFGSLGIVATAIGLAVAASDLHRVTQWMRYPDPPSHLELVFNTAHSLAFGLFGGGTWVAAALTSFWLRKQHDRLIADADDVTIRILGSWCQSTANGRLSGKRRPRWLCQPYKSIQVCRRAGNQKAASQAGS
jgi:hypothetical protein